MIVYTANSEDVKRWEIDLGRVLRTRDTLGDAGLEAARAGDLDALKGLVQCGWNPHVASDKHGSTALMWAAGEGHLHVCKYLVDVCGVNALEKKGGKRMRHPIHWAARNNRTEVCEWLVKKKYVDINIGTDDGTTALHYATWTGAVETVRWLVEIGQCDINQKNYFGCNTSQWCALNGNTATMQYLFSHGLDVCVINSNGRSALHKAAIKGNKDISIWMITPVSDGGGGLNFKHLQADKDGNTPSMLALAHGHNQLFTWFKIIERKSAVKMEFKEYKSSAKTISSNSDLEDTDYLE